MQSFVIEFNRRTRERRVTEFTSAQEAMRHRLELEKSRTDLDIEIAALTASSYEGLQRTHSRYFTGAELSEELLPH
ncbi:MAG: hypothetical protein QM809_05815 [Gordonia sp. (in: high G+C Gram-positive bacteria)]|uniref:hypothetical protein n=1 Tax=Gordonia sp. (in: high G+C Gram-positive bacteria) TaxID=84139 RepID=UPI0039E3048D